MMTEVEKALTGIEPQLALIENRIRESLDTVNPFLCKVRDHFLSAAGKRLRPALVLLAGGGREDERPVRLATALELVHMATLVHDDIIDCSPNRHGIRTVNDRWNNKTAVLLGDFFYARSLTLAAGLGTEIVAGVGELINDLVDGEFYQLAAYFDPTVSEEEYLDRITKKTAGFMAACCRLGALAAEAQKEVVQGLAAYGQYIGLAYQIRDDVLDFTAPPGKTGKSGGLDLAGGIITLPVIHALNSGAASYLRPILEKRKITGRELREIRRLLAECGSYNYALQKAEEYAERAKKSLQVVPCCRTRQALSVIADFSVRREI